MRRCATLWEKQRQAPMPNDERPSARGPKYVAFVYPGWHPDTYRPNVDEWALLDGFLPCFVDHDPPPRPLFGRYDDSDPSVVVAQVRMASSAGIQAFMYFAYYRADGFVMSSPMTHALEVSHYAPEPFSIAAAWCHRLPHKQFPVFNESEADRPVTTQESRHLSLRDTPIEQLTLQKLDELVGEEDPVWEKRLTSTRSRLTLGILRSAIDAVVSSIQEQSPRQLTVENISRIARTSSLGALTIDEVGRLIEAIEAIGDSDSVATLPIRKLESILR
jgi:hypothetical protein